MTESSSSAGNPGGAALPADHPLGPAVPVPPAGKEARRSEQGSGNGDAPATADPGSDATGGQHGDGHPDGDRRNDVLDPSAGSAGQPADTIRDQQDTHAAGAVPAAFNGEGTPAAPHEDRHPEDAAAEPDSWDSGGATS
ncbi:hypothetical protein ACX80L_07545 [Arthrobacter sp. MDT1-48-3]